jgi:hypothetical protein
VLATCKRSPVRPGAVDEVEEGKVGNTFRGFWLVAGLVLDLFGQRDGGGVHSQRNKSHGGGDGHAD